MERLVAEHGPWTTPIDLGFGVLSCDPSTDASRGTRLEELLRVVEDAAGGDVRGLRILDLACLEGMVSVALAAKGAKVVGVEARNPNLARARFAKRALGLENVDFVQDDVRNLSESRHGRHDVVLCFGILYHLPVPDLFEFARRVFTVTDRVVVIDTHVAGPEADRPLLGPLEAVTYEGTGYRGRPYREFEPDSTHENRLKCAWSSLDARPSFWPTRESLLALWSAAGFRTVLEVRAPRWQAMPEDRVIVVAYKDDSTSLPPQ